MGKVHSPCLAELGERELLRRLERFAPPGQLADDAALLPSTPDGRRGVVSSDVLVEDHHFSKTTTPPESVGWRAVMANLSDLAAMGADQVVGVTVGLSCPGSLPWHWLESVYGGMARALDCHGGHLLGGDCVGSPMVSLAMTALGTVDQEHVIRRHGAEVGDWLVCTGPHGLSSYGLSLMLHGVRSQAGEPPGPGRCSPSLSPGPSGCSPTSSGPASPLEHHGTWLEQIAVTAWPRPCTCSAGSRAWAPMFITCPCPQPCWADLMRNATASGVGRILSWFWR